MYGTAKPLYTGYNTTIRKIINGKITVETFTLEMSRNVFLIQFHPILNDSFPFPFPFPLPGLA